MCVHVPEYVSVCVYTCIYIQYTLMNVCNWFGCIIITHWDQFKYAIIYSCILFFQLRDRESSKQSHLVFFTM